MSDSEKEIKYKEINSFIKQFYDSDKDMIEIQYSVMKNNPDVFLYIENFYRSIKHEFYKVSNSMMHALDILETIQHLDKNDYKDEQKIQ